MKLYAVTESIVGETPFDISAIKGTWVAVIKEKDPSGDASKWFVDNGETKGFLQSCLLEPLSIEIQGNTNNNTKIS